MKEEALESICAALKISFSEDLEHQKTILDRFEEIFNLKDKCAQLYSKCEKFQSYSVEVKTVSSNSLNNQTLMVYILESNCCREKTLKPGVLNRIEIGRSSNVSLRFAFSPNKTGENKKGLSRSASLLKKVIWSDKKNVDNLNVAHLPLGSFVKKSINLGNGRSFIFELKLVRNDHRNLIKQLDFEDFLDVTRCVHEWQSTNLDNDCDKYDGNLGDPTFSIFYSIAFFFEIPSFVLKVLEMTCFLVWDDERIELDEKALVDASLKMTACETEVDMNHPLLISSLIYLNDCTCNSITSTLSQFSNEPFFPPVSYIRLKPINDSLKVAIAHICVLSIWDSFPQIASPSTFLSSELQKLLENSSKKWAKSIEKMCFTELYHRIQSLWSKMNSECNSYHIFFQQFDINYVNITLKTISEQIEKSVCICLKHELKEINLRNSEDLEHFTKTTMRLFVTLRSITQLAEAFKLVNCPLNHFEEWFTDITVFWTYSWREVTLQMVERTIRLDEDGDSVKYGARRPLPAGLYSFLCIQKGISDDMTRLEFTYPKHLITCSTAVVNILCQNINAYAKKLFTEAVRTHDEKASRLIRATNGIEQAMCFVEEGYRRFAQFPRLEEFVEEDDILAVQTTSLRLLKTTRETCEKQISTLTTQYVEIKNEIVARIAKNLCADGKESTSGIKSYMREISPSERIEGTLECSYGLVDDIRCLLLPNCFKIATKHFANSLEVEVRKAVRQRQPAEYYSNIYIALKYIYEMLEITENKDVELLSNLHLNSFSTKDLILSYYDSLCEKIERSHFQSTPTVDIHISHIKIESDDTIAIQIKLVKMSPMEWIDVLSERVDYFVLFELFPKVLFPSNKFDSPTTNPVPQSTRPQWKQLFEIKVPLECYFTRGACLAISVFDHERFVDRLVGRGFISLHSVPQSTDDKLINKTRVPLLPNDYSDRENIFYQLLKSRSSQDSIAKEFIETRKRRHLRIGDIQRYIRKNRYRVGSMLLG